MADSKLRRELPDYEETLRKNAHRVLLDAGVPPDEIDAEFERLRSLPLPFDIPTDAELDEMAARRATEQGRADN